MRDRRSAAGPDAVAARGVELLVILDGASEPMRGGTPTSLERAATPALDTLSAEGSLSRVRTVAPWLEAGSEHAIPALLGWTPPAPVDRGAVEAAARGIAVADGERAWRIDVRHAGARAEACAEADAGARADACAEADAGARADAGAEADAGAGGTRADAADALPSLAVALSSHRLHLLGGHRLLAVGPAPLPALPALAGLTLHPWREGIVPPRLLDERTVVIAAPGAAAGLARLLGARVVTPAGATGRPGSDLAAKAAAALTALVDGAERIVVHVGAPDEAAHELDAPAKIAAIEAADRDLIAPLHAALLARAAGTPAAVAGVALRVCPDHGCDPADGRHDAAPVPCVTWFASAARIGTTTVFKTATQGVADAPRSAQAAPRSAQAAPRSAQAAPRSAQAAPRLTERAVAALPVTLPRAATASMRVAA